MQEMLEKVIESRELANKEKDNYEKKIKKIVILSCCYYLIVVILLLLVSTMFVYLEVHPLYLLFTLASVYLLNNLINEKYTNDKWSILSRDEYPFVYSLIDKIQKDLNINYKYIIVPIDDLNIGVTDHNGKVTILLGLMCLKLLNEYELEAALYHEFAHVINKDIKKSKKISMYVEKISNSNSCLNIIFFSYLSYILALEWDLYSHNIKLKSEIEADKLIKDKVDPVEFIDALAKMQSFRNYTERNYLFPLYKDNVEAPKDYTIQIFNKYLLDVKENKQMHIDFINKELTIRFPTHPITKDRMKAIGIDTFNLDIKDKGEIFNNEVNKLINKYDAEWFTFNEKLYKDTRNMEYARYLNVIENSEENDDSSNLANLAFAYEITYNDEKAIELYNRAINLNENNAYALFRLSYLYYKYNDDRCIELMYKAIKLNVHCVEQGMYLIGSYQVRNGNEEGLKEVRRRQIELTQSHIDKVYDERINSKSIIITPNIDEEVLNKLKEIFTKHEGLVFESRAFSQIVNEEEITYISVFFNREDEEAHNVDEEIYSFLESYKKNDYRLVVLNDYSVPKELRKAFLSKNSIEIYKS